MLFVSTNNMFCTFSTKPENRGTASLLYLCITATPLLLSTFIAYFFPWHVYPHLPFIIHVILFLYVILHHSSLVYSGLLVASVVATGQALSLPAASSSSSVMTPPFSARTAVAQRRSLPLQNSSPLAVEWRQHVRSEREMCCRRSGLTTVVSSGYPLQTMRWCLLTWHREAEGCSSDPAERGEKKTTCETCSSSWPAHMMSEGRRVSGVICRFGRTTWQMVLCVCFWQCVPLPRSWLISSVHLLLSRQLRLHVTPCFTLIQVLLLEKQFKTPVCFVSDRETRRSISCLCVKYRA